MQKTLCTLGSANVARLVAAWTQGSGQYRGGACSSMDNGLLIPKFGIKKTRSIAFT